MLPSNSTKQQLHHKTTREMRAKAAHLDEFRKALAAESDDDATRSSSGGGSSSHQQQQQKHQIDLSMLRKPILTAVTGFLEAHRAYESGTDEIRKLLASECDVMYECRVCRNIFRSLTNFISHKRVYCRKLFNAAQHFHFQNDGFLDQDLSTILQAEQDSQLKAKKAHADIANKDLSSIIERLRRKQHKLSGELSLTEYYDRISHKLTQDDLNRQQHVLQLDRVPNSDAAVYQTVRGLEHEDVNGDDAMSAQIGELEALAARKITVLGPDGKVVEPRSRPQSTLPVICDPSNQYFQPIELDRDAGEDATRDSAVIYSCSECNLQFDTERTLKLHMEIKHTPSTFVYPCPSCQRTFLQPGAVIKHLCNDHKKSMRRIKVMRESILKKRTRADEVVVKGSSREVSRLADGTSGSTTGSSSSKDRTNNNNGWDQHDEAAATRAWMENLEHFDQGPMCSYCGKTFDRKAVLTTHMQTCAQKIRQTENGAGSVPPQAGGGGSSSWGSASSSSGRRSRVKEELAPAAPPAVVTRIKQEVVEVVASDDSNSYDVPLSKLQARISRSVNGVVTVKPEEFGLLPQGEDGEARSRRKRQKPTIMLRNANDDICWEGEVEERSIAVVAARVVDEEEDDGVVIKQEPVEVIVVEEEVAKVVKKAPRNRKKKQDEVDDKALVQQIETEGVVVCRCSKKYKDPERLRHHLRVFHSRQRRFWCAICDFKGYRKIDTVNHLIQEHGYKGGVDDIGSLINFQPVEKRKRKTPDRPIKTEPANHICDTSTTEPSSLLESTLESATSDQNNASAISMPTPEPPASPRKRGRPPRSSSIRDSICSLPPDDSSFKKRKFFDHSSTPEDDSLSTASKRPIRNRVKPVDKDFVYDLTHLLHKEEDLDDFPLPELLQEKSPPVRSPPAKLLLPPPPPPPPPTPPSIPRSRTRSSSVSSRTSSSTLSTPEKRDSNFSTPLPPPPPPPPTPSKKESLRSHAPKPKPVIPPEVFRGAAHAMAKRQVEAGRAVFRSPPPIPQERTFIPAQMSPPKHQPLQSPNPATTQQRRNVVQTIHDWPVVKKERRIGSITKSASQSDIQIKHKYVKLPQLLREQQNRRVPIPRRNSVAPSQSRARLSATVKILNKLNASRSAAGLELVRVTDVPVPVHIPTPAEFRRYIEANLKDHRATMAQVNVNGTMATAEEEEGGPSTSPRKRITLMQRLEENRSKRMQEQNGSRSPTKSNSALQGATGSAPSNSGTTNVADMLQAKLKKFSSF